MMRNTSWKLKKVKDLLLNDLKVSTLSFGELGKRYGVSKQAVFEFAQRRGIKRSNRPKTEHTKTCSICQSIIRIAKGPHSDFISSQTIKRRLGLAKSKWLYHIHILRKRGLVSPRFGRLRSQKVERAYQLYFKKRQSVRAIGREVGLKNFNSAIKKHRASGFDIPASPFKYDSHDRSKAALKRRKKSKT